MMRSPFKRGSSTKSPSIGESKPPSYHPDSKQAAMDDEKKSQSDRSPSPVPSTQPQAILEEAKKQTAEHEGEDETEYPSSWKLAIITLALCLSVFCMALDNTIIATAIPRITGMLPAPAVIPCSIILRLALLDQFNSIDDVGWYGSAYLLTVSALQLFFGRLYSFYSIKWTYLIALGIFEVNPEHPLRKRCIS